jgi:hypothetical protein
MCDRTIKMKLKKGSILSNVNSNTNSIELTVKGLDTKSFNYKKQSHVNEKQVNDESFENREKMSTYRDWSWSPDDVKQ